MKKPTTRQLAQFFVASCSFLLGRLLSTAWQLQYPRSSIRTATRASSLQHDVGDGGSHHHSLEQQIRDQETFQSMLQASQHPQEEKDCAFGRFLVRDEIPPKDGFASEFQYIARLLQSSLSTSRILFVTKDWKSAYCLDSGWTCLWQPITNCTQLPSGRHGRRGKGKEPNRTTTSFLLNTMIQNPLTYGILPRKHRPAATASAWFDPTPYGNARPILPAPNSFPLKYEAMIMDVIPHWERVYGRYWIRSQMVHYLWRPAEWLQEEMDRRVISILPQAPFIGLHVRLTDNIPDFAKGFGRDATNTRRLENYYEIAQDIHRTHKSSAKKNIFIATDHAQVILRAKKVFQGWTVWSQQDVQRATTQQRIWFAGGRSTAAGAMAMDLEMLRRADFLIGSFQSNVFRLAAELNTAWHVRNYSIHQPRHFTVDVEWFEDP